MSGAYARAEGVLRTVWTPLVLCSFMVLIWLVITQIVDQVFYNDEAEKYFLRLLIVLALQMFSGNSGILSFGQVAFVAVGAYTSALLTIPTAIKQFTFLSMPHFLKDLGLPDPVRTRSRGRSREAWPRSSSRWCSAYPSSAWSAWRRASRRSRSSWP